MELSKKTYTKLLIYRFCHLDKEVEYKILVLKIKMDCGAFNAWILKETFYFTIKMTTGIANSKQNSFRA